VSLTRFPLLVLIFTLLLSAGASAMGADRLQLKLSGLERLFPAQNR